MVKILIRRRDGVLQRYNVKDPSKYQKSGVKQGRSFVYSKITRSRQQVVYNCDYAISIRAIGFNNKFTEEQLTAKIEEVLVSNPHLLNIPFDTEGIENENIDDKEDAGLNQNEITVELNIRGSVTLV